MAPSIQRTPQAGCCQGRSADDSNDRSSAAVECVSHATGRRRKNAPSTRTHRGMRVLLRALAVRHGGVSTARSRVSRVEVRSHRPDPQRGSRVRRKGVRVNAICPGVIDTPMVADMVENQADAMAAILQEQPIGRLGTADEIAAAVLWLCSPSASFVVGTAIPVDGGFTAH